MDDVKFEKFIEYFNKSFKSVLLEMTDLEAVLANEEFSMNGETITVIMGTTGKNKGRVLLQAEEKIANAVAEKMNGEPFESIEERNIYLGEFVNVVCGNAITKINNYYLESELRLTPPAIFAGVDLNIVTPNIQSEKLYYIISDNRLVLDIGFEGA